MWKYIIRKGFNQTKGALSFSTVIVMVALLIATPLEAAEILRYGNSGLVVSVSGSIAPGDDVKFSNLTHDMATIIVNLASAGGDVEASVRLGRIIRARAATVFSEGCFSACVLLYAAGVRRVGGIDETSSVGIHRIYFAQLESNLSQAQVQRRYSAALSDVRQFLADMNVASGFIDFMQSIPPERMRLLTTDELEQFGLGQIDPVHEEKTIADEAWALAISSFEYRRRRDDARRMCATGDRRHAEDTSFRSPQRDCENARIWGISIEEYLARSRRANASCAAIGSGDKYRRCIQQSMRAAAQ